MDDGTEYDKFTEEVIEYMNGNAEKPRVLKKWDPEVDGSRITQHFFNEGCEKTLLGIVITALKTLSLDYKVDESTYKIICSRSNVDEEE